MEILVWLGHHAPITPTFMSGSSREIAWDYVEKWMLAHHFSHYYSRKCRQMVSQVVGMISSSCEYTHHKLWPIVDSNIQDYTSPKSEMYISKRKPLWVINNFHYKNLENIHNDSNNSKLNSCIPHLDLLMWSCTLYFVIKSLHGLNSKKCP